MDTALKKMWRLHCDGQPVRHFKVHEKEPVFSYEGAPPTPLPPLSPNLGTTPLPVSAHLSLGGSAARKTSRGAFADACFGLDQQNVQGKSSRTLASQTLQANARVPIHTPDEDAVGISGSAFLQQAQDADAFGDVRGSSPYRGAAVRQYSNPVDLSGGFRDSAGGRGAAGFGHSAGFGGLTGYGGSAGFGGAAGLGGSPGFGDLEDLQGSANFGSSARIEVLNPGAVNLISNKELPGGSLTGALRNSGALNLGRGSSVQNASGYSDWRASAGGDWKASYYSNLLNDKDPPGQYDFSGGLGLSLQMGSSDGLRGYSDGLEETPGLRDRSGAGAGCGWNLENENGNAFQREAAQQPMKEGAVPRKREQRGGTASTPIEIGGSEEAGSVKTPFEIQDREAIDRKQAGRFTRTSPRPPGYTVIGLEADPRKESRGSEGPFLDEWTKVNESARSSRLHDGLDGNGLGLKT